MICPRCNSKKTYVIDSRYSNAIKGARRRRRCEDCGFRFTTYEVLNLAEFEKDIEQRIVERIIHTDFNDMITYTIKKRLERNHQNLEEEENVYEL